MAHEWRRPNTNGLGPEGVGAKAVLCRRCPINPHPDTGLDSIHRKLIDRYDARAGQGSRDDIRMEIVHLTPHGPKDRESADRPHQSEIEITPEMIEAGERVFYEEMTKNDYLDRAPSADVLEEIISKIFCSMLEVYPADRRKFK